MPRNIGYQKGELRKSKRVACLSRLQCVPGDFGRSHPEGLKGPANPVSRPGGSRRTQEVRVCGRNWDKARLPASNGADGGSCGSSRDLLPQKKELWPRPGNCST